MGTYFVLPDMCALVGREIEFVADFDTEGIVPSVDHVFLCGRS